MDTILVVLVSGKCDYYSQLFFIIYVSSFWLFCLLAVRTYSVQQYLVDTVVQLRVAVEYWACH